MAVDYKNQSGRNFYVPERILSKKLEGRLQDLLPLINDRARILEVGCAEGHLCSYLRMKRSIKYVGVEPSLDAEIAARTLDEVYASIEDIDKKARFDFILSFHTLEHIPDPFDELKKWRNLLDENGMIILEVPNGAGHPDIVLDTNKEHVHFFTPSTITSLLESANFETINLSSGNFESPMYPDSIRVFARVSVTKEQRHLRLLKRFQKISPPIAMYGVGGDFNKFVVPVIRQLDGVVLFDSTAVKRTNTNLEFSPTLYCNLIHHDYNIIVTSFRFQDEIRKILLDSGHHQSKIWLLADII